MKKSLVLLASVMVAVAAQSATEGPNMSIKVSPGIPKAGEPIVYEAVLSGGTENYQIAWQFLDPFEILNSISSTNGIPSLPELVYGLTVTNIFQTGGLKEVIALIQKAGETNGLTRFITMRIIAFPVLASNDAPLTLRYPNGGELWIPGNTYEIAWSTNSTKFVAITLEQKGDTNNAPLAIYTENDGSFNFTVPYGTNWVSKGTEGNLGGKNYRVRVTPTDISSLFGSSWFGNHDAPLTDISDASDDWFTIAGGVKINPAPLTIQNLGFSMASVRVDGTIVGKMYHIESSINFKDWRANHSFRAKAESSTNDFPILGSPSQSFRLVEEQ